MVYRLGFDPFKVEGRVRFPVWERANGRVVQGARFKIEYLLMRGFEPHFAQTSLFLSAVRFGLNLLTLLLKNKVYCVHLRSSSIDGRFVQVGLFSRDHLSL